MAGNGPRPRLGPGGPTGSIAADIERRDHDDSLGSPAELAGAASAEFFGGDAPKARFGRPTSK
jgi:hypothetical protein